MGSSSKMKDEFKIAMMNEFEMKYLGLMQYFMGMEVYKNEDEIFICKTKYAKDMLKKFDMVECKLASTPTAHGIVLCRDDGVEIVDETTYKSIVGSLMFLTHTRPDISYSVFLISRYMTEPSEIHMKATKRILRYVKGTLNFGIHYYTSKRFNLVGFSDFDWGGSLDDQKSTSGNCLSFGSGLITWSSKKQSIVSLSSTEAEYVAVTSTGTQALWLRKVLEEIGEKKIHPTMILCDNTSAIKLAKNPVHHRRTKHFDLKYQFIRDLVQKKEVELRYIKTQEQLVDIFTKAVSKVHFLKL
jgi:hypothetical protein